jgi:hypothetical protein
VQADQGQLELEQIGGAALDFRVHGVAAGFSNVAECY